MPEGMAMLKDFIAPAKVEAGQVLLEDFLRPGTRLIATKNIG